MKSLTDRQMAFFVALALLLTAVGCSERRPEPIGVTRDETNSDETNSDTRTEAELTPIPGASGDLSSEPEPPDTRPERPAWETSLPLGDSGWADSREEYCTHRKGQPGSFDVWADDRGVFSLYVTWCNGLRGGCPGDAPGVSLHFNDGTGWQYLYGKEAVTLLMSLGGVANGPLLLAGDVNQKQGVFQCSEGTFELMDTLVDQLFPVGESLLFARSASDPGMLLQLTGNEWEPVAQPLPAPFSIQAVWADTESIVLTTPRQRIYRKRHSQNEFHQVLDVPAGDYDAVWGHGHEVFVADGEGQLLHFDGSAWSVVKLNLPEFDRIIELWGANGIVYFISVRGFGRYSVAGGPEIIHVFDDAEQAAYWAIWGRSASEVFVSVHDQQLQPYECGGAVMLWFDGQQLHRF